MPTSIPIMLIEDSPAYRKVIAMALQNEQDLELCDAFGTAEIALRDLQEKSKDEQPAVILLDLRLPGMDGLEAMPWIVKYAPEARILVLTQSDDEQDVMEAVKQGATGYLSKASTVSQICSGIRSVAAGGATLGSGVTKILLDKLRPGLANEVGAHGLSPREIETLTLISRGMVKKQIAAKLDIGYTTVDTYVKKIYDKLGVNNAAAAVSKGHKLGLIPFDP